MAERSATQAAGAVLSSTSDFPKFSKIVNESFQRLVKETVFDTGDGEGLWAAYLAAFPEGSDLIFKKRTEHDCSCCRHFIRRAGTITDGVRTVWDEAAEAAPYPYCEVAVKLRDLVRARAIVNLYMVSKQEASFGAEKTCSQVKDGPVITWNHFYTSEIPAKLRSDTVDTIRGAYRTNTEVFERGLKELSSDAVATVLSLIEANNLYRGEEHKPALQLFMKAQAEYKAAANKQLYVWQHASGAAARFRNSVIGTLVVDLADGVDVDKAVRSFEAKVAPENYKRTSAVITPGMIKKAMETLTELGLEPALERRFAKISDISVNDVKWVDNRVKPLMKGGIGDRLMAEVKSTPMDTKNAEKISLDALMALLPSATAIEVFFENRHVSSLVSLTAPVHPEPRQLFKWDNDFAWSYNGNIADSAIRQAVQSRGGRVDGVFRFSHSWNHEKRNASLMDLHVFMPNWSGHSGSGTIHDSYGNTHRVGWNNRNHYASGGTQDVDYVQAAPAGYVPVENTTFPALDRMPEGKYVCKIHNWQLRPPTEGGFRAEIEFEGQLFEYEYDKPLKNKEWVTVATVTLARGKFSIEHHIPCGSVSQDRWGMQTEKFVKVNAVTLSPNYWGTNKVGNKHLFFFLEGAKNDEPTRGIYNEFLNARLEPHRKVFEVIGDKTKCQPTDGQLSGLGFSSTKSESVLVKLNNKRLYLVQTGGSIV